MMLKVGKSEYLIELHFITKEKNAELKSLMLVVQSGLWDQFYDAVAAWGALATPPPPPSPPVMFQNWNSKVSSLSVLNTECFILYNFFIATILKTAKMANDMERLEVLMRQEIQIFLVVFIVYIFMGLVLQVVNPFMPGGDKRSKTS